MEGVEYKLNTEAIILECSKKNFENLVNNTEGSDKTSFGIEFYTSWQDKLTEHRSEITHIQVTAPANVSFQNCEQLSAETPLVLHSNVFSPFGDNNPIYTNLFSNKIRNFRAIHVIEHFSNFSASSSQFLYPNRDNTKISKQAIFDKCKKWQNEICIPLAFENVPVTMDVEWYFDLLLEMREKTGIEITCDVSHLLMSCAASENPMSLLRSILPSLNPLHIHLSGLEIKDGKIFDNHYSFPQSIIEFAKMHFKSAKFVTFEPYPNASKKKTLNILRKTCVNWKFCQENFEFSGFNRFFEHQPCNDDEQTLHIKNKCLKKTRNSSSTADLMQYFKNSEAENKHIFSSSFDLLNSFNRIVKVKETLEVLLSNLEVESQITDFATLISKEVRKMLLYQTWFNQQTENTIEIALIQAQRVFFCLRFSLREKNMSVEKIQINTLKEIQNSPMVRHVMQREDGLTLAICESIA
jgi:hypothetical protein